MLLIFQKTNNNNNNMNTQTLSSAIITEERDVYMEDVTADWIEFFPDEYDEGMTTFCRPLHIPIHLPLDSDAVQSIILYNLGISSVHRKQDEDAVVCFQRALSLIRSFVPRASHDDTTTAPDTIAVLHNLGHIHFREGRHADALCTYKEALHLACERHGSHHLDVAATLTCIAVARFHLFSDPSALQLSQGVEDFTKALEIRRAIIGHVKDRESATIKNNLGRILLLRGQFELALSNHEDAYRIRSSIFGECHLDVAATVYNAAQANDNLDNTIMAMHLYQKFLDIVVPKVGENHFHVATAYVRLGHIHHERNDLCEAFELYFKGLKSAKGAFGLNHPEVAAILNKIGNICAEFGDSNSALKSYLEGLRIEREVFPADSPNIAVTLLNIARIYQRQESFDKSLELYTEALAVQRSTQGQDQAAILNIAATLACIGAVQEHLGNFEAAIETYEEALRLRSSILGHCHFDISSMLNAIGIIRFKAGNLDLAIASFEDSLRIRRSLAKPCASHEIATLVFNIAAMHMESGDSSKSLEYLKEALDLELADSSSNPLDILNTLQRIGVLHNKRGELDEALQYFEQGVTIGLNADFSGTVPLTEVAKFFSFVGNVHLQRGDTGNAVTFFTKAMRTNRLAGVSEHSNLVVDGLCMYDLSKAHRSCAAAA